MNMHLLIMALLFMTANISKAQWRYESLPATVDSSFKKIYPEVNIKKVDWDWKNSCFKAINCYEANFKEGGKRNKVYFDSKGNWISTRQKDLTLSDVPNGVKDTMDASGYTDWEIKEIWKVSTTNNVSYEIKVKKGRKNEDLYYDEYGNKVGKEKI